MKVIAQSAPDRFLVEVTHEELRLISGDDLQRDYGSRSLISVGWTFDVVSSWKHMKTILGMKESVLMAGRNLRALADMVEAIPNNIEMKMENKDEK